MKKEIIHKKYTHLSFLLIYFFFTFLQTMLELNYKEEYFSSFE